MCVYVVAMDMWGDVMCEDGAGGPSSEDWARGHRLLKPEEHYGMMVSFRICERMCRGFARHALIMETCGCALPMHTLRRVTSLVSCLASCKVCPKTSRGQPTPCAVGAPRNVASRRLLWRAIVPMMCAVGARSHSHACVESISDGWWRARVSALELRLCRGQGIR